MDKPTKYYGFFLDLTEMNWSDIQDEVRAQKKDGVTAHAVAVKVDGKVHTYTVSEFLNLFTEEHHG